MWWGVTFSKLTIRGFEMKHIPMTVLVFAFPIFMAQAQSEAEFEAVLCEAAENKRVVELVYDQDASKGCEPRLVDVHQIALGNNGQYYLHGWQWRGCTKGRDYASERIFKFEKIKSVNLIEGEFEDKSRAIKDEGWDGCLGNNCFIKEMICE